MRVTVIYPVTFDVDDNELIDSDGQPLTGVALRNAVLDIADNLLVNNTVLPIIHDCTNPELID